MLSAPRLISATQVNTYFECPYKYKLAYIDQAKPLYQPAYDFGSKVHAVLREYYNSIPDTLTTGDVPIYLSKAWKAVFGEVDDRAMKYMDGFMKFEAKRLTWHINPKPIAIEKEYRVGRLHGIVDAVFRRGDDKVIVDWKTGMKRDPSLDEALMFQGNMYMFLVGAKEIYFVFVRYGEYYKLEFDEGYFKSRLANFLSAVKANKFDRSEGEHCKRCEFSLHCYLDKYKLEWWEL